MKLLEIFIRRIFPPLIVTIFPLFIFSGDINSLGLGDIKYIGIIILVIGFVIDIFSLWYWDSKNTNELITDGLYKYSRNPQYLGTMLILLGSSLILNSYKLLRLTLLAFILLNILIIFIEEKDMKKSFGDKYREYCKRTGRWFMYL